MSIKEIPKEIYRLINADLAWHYKVIPFNVDNGIITFLASSDQVKNELENELKLLIGKEMKFEFVSNQEINSLLVKYYRQTSSFETTVQNLDKKEFINKLLSEANQLGSSDIHIETYNDNARIRFRIDGNLIQRFTLAKEDYPEIVNKIKIRANLDISEKRLPQDGRIKFTDFDLRISILPTIYGEKIVLRILGRDSSKIDIQQIGMASIDLDNYLSGIRKTKGIVLISGPTGSGKTTTLYATLKYLNDEKRNILTVEDPVEYTLSGINQVQLKEDIGLNFATALKSFLRQDPDVIMLGEIRDSETAQMAIRAALTGHLVLSTIHTNSSIETISRLKDMGVPSFLIASTLNTSIAQRLIRKLCPSCKTKSILDLKDWPINLNGLNPPKEHWLPVGCESCFYTGYVGRKAIYEVLPISKEIKNIIRENKEIDDQTIEQSNFSFISSKAYADFMAGTTSLEEVYSLLMS